MRKGIDEQTGNKCQRSKTRGAHFLPAHENIMKNSSDKFETSVKIEYAARASRLLSASLLQM